MRVIDPGYGSASILRLSYVDNGRRASASQEQGRGGLRYWYGGGENATGAVGEAGQEGDVIGHLAKRLGEGEKRDGSNVTRGHFQRIAYAHEQMQNLVIGRVLPDGRVVGDGVGAA